LEKYPPIIKSEIKLKIQQAFFEADQKMNSRSRRDQQMASAMMVPESNRMWPNSFEYGSGSESLQQL